MVVQHVCREQILYGCGCLCLSVHDAQGPITMVTNSTCSICTVPVRTSTSLKVRFHIGGVAMVQQWRGHSRSRGQRKYPCSAQQHPQLLQGAVQNSTPLPHAASKMHHTERIRPSFLLHSEFLVSLLLLIIFYNNNNNEILIKCEPLVYTKSSACCTEKQKNSV